MPVAIENLIPHRAPMLFINTLTDCTEKSAKAEARFDEKDFAVVDGMVLETALVECMAQTVGAALGHQIRTKDGNAPAANGMLVAVSNFKIQSRPSAGKLLQIEVRERKRLGPMILIAGTITCDGQIIASGELSLYV
jgi:predicted hotdog family 3-hydroxylacyl-ACP dehydratase